MYKLALLKLAAYIVPFMICCVVIFFNSKFIWDERPAPDWNLTEYWGPGNVNRYTENTAVLPFDISAKPEQIEELTKYLNRSLYFPPAIKGVGFEYGFNADELLNLTTYWRDIYLPNWNEREETLKEYPHYQTQIQGLKLHFMHVRPKETEKKVSVPILLLHGWPSSIREFYGIMPFLITPNNENDYVFEVIVPSLPGFGWSEGASKPGLSPAKMAYIFRNLMDRLGHKKFFVHGSDWGAMIGSYIAAFFPDSVFGYHSTWCHSLNPLSQLKSLLTFAFPRVVLNWRYANFSRPFYNHMLHFFEESGHWHLHATRPDTIGFALENNPVGLAAYILEKFSQWTNPRFIHLRDGGLTKRYSIDALLDNVMIYYLTNSATTSLRMTKEYVGIDYYNNYDAVHVVPPTGCARFRHGLLHSSDMELSDRFIHITQSTYYNFGGHFAALEKPKVVYEDLVTYIQTAFPSSLKKKPFKMRDML